MNKYALTVENLTKVFSDYKNKKENIALNNLSFKVNQGEVFGLLGPNGAGKTTCFYMIAGLINTDEGDIILDQSRINHLPMHIRAKNGIGYLPQESSIFRGLTVEQNIIYGVKTNKNEAS